MDLLSRDHVSYPSLLGGSKLVYVLVLVIFYSPPFSPNNDLDRHKHNDKPLPLIVEPSWPMPVRPTQEQIARHLRSDETCEFLRTNLCRCDREFF